MVAPLVATAQPDYRPMLCEGRVWNEHCGAGLNMAKTLYFNGDTVIEGETYKKLYEHTTFINNGDTVITDKLQVPVMEKDRRVYAYIHRKVTVYDFTLQAGDSLVLGKQEWIRINKIDTISVKGGLYCRFHVTHVMKDYLGVEWSGDADEDAFWVEGIGCDKGLTALFGWMGTAAPYARTSVFDNCIENGETLFTLDDFNTPAWKNPDTGDSDNKKCATPTITYDNGRLVFSCETEGAECVYEIKCADSGSGCGGEVSLGQTYEIRVHATLDGYEDSDVAVATIGWRNGRPVMEGFSSVTMDGGDGNADVNGDGKVDGADIATVISVMAGQQPE